MTYEEKLEKIIFKLKEERKLTRKNHKTRVSFDDRSFTKVRIRDICKILLQLQDDENILKIIEGYKIINDEGNYGKITDYDYEHVEILKVELAKKFDDWYENYLIKEKSKLENLSKDNFENIFNILRTIENELQICQSEKLNINFISSVNELEGYEKTDIDDLISYYVRALTYLKNIGAINEFTTEQNTLSSELTVNVNRFNEILEKAENRNQRISEQSQRRPKTQGTQKKITHEVNYDPSRGVLKIETKRVRFKKDSFRAKLLELLLKDDKSRKKEWSWDEIIEAIEDTKDKNLTKEKKKKFYPACDGLSKHIALKTGVNDLLLYNKSTVQITPKYL